MNEIIKDLVSYQNILKKQADEFSEQIFNCEWNTIEELHKMSFQLESMVSSIKLCEYQISQVIDFFGGGE